MAGYVLKRLLRSLVSLVVVVFIIMLLVFKLMNREQIFKTANLTRYTNNKKIEFKYKTYEEYGYMDVIEYQEYASDWAKENETTAPELPDGKKVKLPDNKTIAKDEDIELVMKFKNDYTNNGYTIIRELPKNNKDANILIAYKERSVFARLWDFFSGLFVFDTVNYAQNTEDYSNYVAKYGEVEKKIYFATDPMNGLPCIMGSGTKHKYLFYFDNVFPFVHQNFLTLNLGKRYSSGKDFFEYFTENQGEVDFREYTYPDGSVVKDVGYDFHEREFNPNIKQIDYDKFQDGYSRTNKSYRDGLSMIGYSFIIGIIATILVYIIGVPLGLLLALKKDKITDKIGNLYIIFIMAVPSLAYIYLFALIGGQVFGLPTNWPTGTVPLVFILPIVSLALPSIATMMKWTRRYMIDQMTSDYVKFARSQGFSEGEIFRKHILKNALIPIVQGIPASIIGSLTGAIITERVYNVPGMGKLLTTAIDECDNGVIVGLSFFYAFLSIISLILGDILMAKTDPRISFSGGGGRR